MSGNFNYEGSVAESYIDIRTGTQVEEDNSTEIFNCISLYMPKSLASGNLLAGSFDPATITGNAYAVITLTADNFEDIAIGEFKDQWEDAFNNYTNFDLILYVIVFNDDTFSPTISAKNISWMPLTKAFKGTYQLCEKKMMFSESYDGNTTSDTNYVDMALALACLCNEESKFSECMIYAKLTPATEDLTDTNLILFQSKSINEETSAVGSSIASSTAEERKNYLWGVLKLIASERTWIFWNNGKFMASVVIGKWFSQGKNESGLYLGNSYAGVRLSGTGIKPTGTPNSVVSDINDNLPLSVRTILDSKNIGYFISISAKSDNDCILTCDYDINGFPLNATSIGHYIDYQTSQDIANWYADTQRKLCNKDTYETIKGFLYSNIQKFTSMGRLENVVFKFPSFSQVKVGNTITGTGVWEATYIGDVKKIRISGIIKF